MKVPKSLLLQQQYLDTWENYILAKESKIHPTWDYVAITASNDFQAKGYDHQIQQRIEFLPKRTKFITVPDEGNQRVGSGGATLSVLRKIKQLEGTFSGLRILVIHSGGDSKRIPQYSALGKLFSPVPRVLPDGRSSTLFDEIIISMSSVATRIQEGMVLLSGDVLLLFNPLKIDFSLSDVGCLTFKIQPEIGKNHGVFISGKNGYVIKCLQKRSVEVLKAAGAVDENGFVDIDTGAIIFSCKYMDVLYSLIDTDEKYLNIVNSKVRLSLYIEFLFPLGLQSTLELFLKEKPEGEMCDELIEVRKKIWDLIKENNFKLKQIKLSPSAMIHFGSIQEIMTLMNTGMDDYRDIGWNNIINSSSDKISSYNSILTPGCRVGENSYVELSYVHRKAKVGKNSLLSFVEVNDVTIPEDVVLHGLKQNNGKIVCRIFGIHDNPKENKLFGKNINELPFGLDGNLWEAKLYPECDTMKEAIDNALNIYNTSMNFVTPGYVDEWKKYTKKSLSSGFNDADPESLIEWWNKMTDLVKCGKVERLIYEKKNVENVKGLFDTNKLNNDQQSWLKAKLDRSDFSEKIRLLYYMGVAIGDDNLINQSFSEVKNSIIEQNLRDKKYDTSLRIIKNKHKVSLPLRVNFAGGWTDTPPYCMENGGKILNCPILLDGSRPVEVCIEKIKEKKIILESKDLDEKCEYTNIEDIQDVDDPFEPFSLQKAALLICGIIPRNGGNLDEILERLGSGFVIHSEIVDTPKGSGLGNTSILAAACTKAILEFFGIKFTENDLYNDVLAIEQIMGTGGGWQDQVGGVSKGINLVTSEKGIKQNIVKRRLNISDNTMKQLKERFCLIYTGERRLQRNLLKDVVKRYIGNVGDNIRALDKIKGLADEMAYALESDNINLFASLLNCHLQYSKMIDSGATNGLIDKIFEIIDDMIDGKMVCGAGGGGFLQVILKKNVTKEMLHNKLRGIFPDSEIDVWECNIDF
jgi:fucokinase